MKSEEEMEEVVRLIVWERRRARSTIYTTWILGIVGAVVGVIWSGWVWLFVLAVPIVVNALVVNNAYHRIARKARLDVTAVHELWRYRSLEHNLPYPVKRPNIENTDK